MLDKLNEAAFRVVRRVFGPVDDAEADGDKKTTIANSSWVVDPFIFLPFGGAIVLVGVIFGLRVMTSKDKKEIPPDYD